jgi:hypothetical protein
MRKFVVLKCHRTCLVTSADGSWGERVELLGESYRVRIFYSCTNVTLGTQFKCIYACYDHKGTKRPMRKFVVLEYHRNCSVTSADGSLGGGRAVGLELLCTDIVVVQM